MLEKAGVPTEALSDADAMLSVDSVAGLLEESARQSGLETFGLMLSESRGLGNLGAVGLVVREEPTLRDAVHVLLRYVHLQNRALELSLEDMGEFSLIHLDLRLRRHQGSRQGMEMAAGVLVRTLRFITQSAFVPVRVCFVHGRSSRLDTHRRVLGAPVDFSQAFNAVVCRSRDLDMVIPGADAALSRTLKSWLDSQLNAAHEDPVEPVRQVIRTLLPTGNCTVEHVANYLGTHRRTLNRRLAGSGESVSSVIDGVRVQVAETYLAMGTRTHYEIAHLLGFASGAEFSRWFRAQFGMTASQWESSQRGHRRVGIAHAQEHSSEG
jgi:AraC-like DNA-binding protein